MDAENNIADKNKQLDAQQAAADDDVAQTIELQEELSEKETQGQYTANCRRLVLDNEGKPLEDEDQEPHDVDEAVENVDEITQPAEVEDEDEDDEDEVLLDDDGKLDLITIFRILKRYWWMIALNCLIVGTIAALLIVEEPRIYTSSVILAPEAEYGSAGGGLSSLASSFGIDIGNISSSDAIRPDLYPNLVSSADFIMDLFSLPVKTLDGNVYTDYYTYLKKYQRMSWWRHDMREFMLKFKDKPKDPKAMAGTLQSTQSGENKRVIVVSQEEEGIIEGIRSAINCSVDKQTFTISITVSDQDPLVCATVADSVRSKIQTFVTNYRTKKAANDFNYYYKLLKQAKGEYEKAVNLYAKYVDSHRDVILQSYISERDQLENNMQIKLNTYNAMLTQAQNAKAKIQETTPAFTVMQNALVPIKPSGPKRMMFVLGFVFMTFVVTAFFIILRS